MQQFQVVKAEAPAALRLFPCLGWVELTDIEYGDKAIGAVLHDGHIRVPRDVSTSPYGIEITPADCAETCAAARALFA